MKILVEWVGFLSHEAGIDTQIGRSHVRGPEWEIGEWSTAHFGIFEVWGYGYLRMPCWHILGGERLHSGRILGGAGWLF